MGYIIFVFIFMLLLYLGIKFLAFIAKASKFLNGNNGIREEKKIPGIKDKDIVDAYFEDIPEKKDDGKESR